MRQHLRFAACVVVGLLAAPLGGRAVAQGYIPPRPGGITPITNPTVSPYINLLRPGGTSITNYFGLVRPEFDLRNAAGTLQNQLGYTDQYLNNLAAYNATAGYAPLATGHAASFLNLEGRFLNRNPTLPRGYALTYGPGYGAAGGVGGGYGAGGYGAGGYGFGGFGGAGLPAGSFGAGARNFGASGLGGFGAGGAGALPRPSGPSGYPR
jgi:hypothetical protein